MCTEYSRINNYARLRIKDAYILFKYAWIYFYIYIYILPLLNILFINTINSHYSAPLIKYFYNLFSLYYLLNLSTTLLRNLIFNIVCFLLLFFRFHNMPSNYKRYGSFLFYLNSLLIHYCINNFTQFHTFYTIHFGLSLLIYLFHFFFYIN